MGEARSCRRVRLRYGTQQKSRPPTFVLFANGRLTTGEHAGTAGTNYLENGALNPITADPDYLDTWN